ncbi:MAG: NnrU family protein [Halorhodospira sp.]
MTAMATVVLILGLALFLGAHSTRMLAPAWRQGQIEQRGEKRWKGSMALSSLAGLVLIIAGYAFAHGGQPEIWQAPAWLDPIVGTLMLAALILATAAFVSGSQLRVWVGHPLVAAVGLWSLAHLIATGGRVVDLALFGLFLLWAAFDFFSLRRRDREAGTVPQMPAGLKKDAVAIGIGVVVYLAFVVFLHELLFGVPAFRY